MPTCMPPSFLRSRSTESALLFHRAECLKSCVDHKYLCPYYTSVVLKLQDGSGSYWRCRDAIYRVSLRRDKSRINRVLETGILDSPSLGISATVYLAAAMTCFFDGTRLRIFGSYGQYVNNLTECFGNDRHFRSSI
jgi:hypothetical protein